MGINEIFDQYSFEEMILRDNLFGINLELNIIKNMILADIKQALFETNLNFDSSMASEVATFFTQNGIETDKQNIHLLSIATAAIISQTKLVPCRGQQKYTKYGISIEMVMGHLHGYSKEQFLQRISYLISKNHTLQNKLSLKIKNVQLSYRLFKKYRKTFQQLWPSTGINSLVMNDMLSIFWVVYLLIKNNKDDFFEDLQQQIKLLIVMLKSIFEYWIPCNNQNIIQQILQQNFNRQNQLINEEYFIRNHLQFLNLMQKHYQLRYQNSSLDFKKFSKNPIQIARFLDDISNHFYKEQQIFQSKIDNYIDEISYLQLKKTLAPQGIKQKPAIDLPVIKLNIKFSMQDKDDSLSSESKNGNSSPISAQIQNENSQFLSTPSSKPMNNFIISQNLPQMTPIRQRRDISGATPCFNRIANLQWVRTCLDSMQRSQAQNKFKKVFSFVQKASLQQFQQKSKQQLLYIVQEFSPKCLKKQKRVKEIFDFFTYLIVKIYEHHDQKENARMFNQLKTFSSILCLSCDMFNFAYSSMISSYRKQCEIFDVALIDAIKPINWIAIKIQKPKQLNDHLYSLQKRIVITEIWEDETGYNLIKSQQNYQQSFSIPYNDMIIWRRLKHHISQRIKQLSLQIKLDTQLIKRSQNLLDLILKQKPFLLYKNKIDQIIICCLTCFLTINQIHQKQTLQKVFRDYNKIEFSQHSNKEKLQADGKEMTLTDFYNQIFLPQIQDIIQNNINDSDFLLTPIRKTYQKIWHSQSQFTPFTQKYPQDQIDSTQHQPQFGFPFITPKFNESASSPMFKSNQLLSPTPSYRKKLVMRNYKIEQENRQKMKKVQEKQEQTQNNMTQQRNFGFFEFRGDAFKKRKGNEQHFE